MRQAKVQAAKGRTASSFVALGAAALFMLRSIDSQADVPGPSMAQAPASDVAAENRSRQAWRETMSRTRLPRKGCFRASHPDPEWHQVSCAIAPPGPVGSPRSDEIEPESIGNGTDNTLEVSGLLTQVVGSFPTVTGVTSETDGAANSFSLQINSNTFATSACSGGGAACRGWQQFVFSNDGSSSGFVFMQYWLIAYVGTCPAGYLTFGSSCYKNSAATAVTVQTIASLANFTLTSSASVGGQDVVTLSIGASSLFATGLDSVLNLGQGWNAAEFNVFGRDSGKTASFNTGSTLTVRMDSTDGTTTPPLCISGAGTTGETNNLNLLHSCCPNGGASPGITFMETNATGLVRVPFCVATEFVPTMVIPLLN